MADFSVIFAGFGGQGVLFSGKVMAYHGIARGKEVSWMPSYGPEMRGGTANCTVCISDMPVGSPVVTAPDVLIAMNEPSYDKFAAAVKPGGILVYDSSIFEPKNKRGDINYFAVPATAMANEAGLGGISNMILLGKMLRETGMSDMQTIESAIQKAVPAAKTEMIGHNISALKLGLGLSDS